MSARPIEKEIPRIPISNEAIVAIMEDVERLSAANELLHKQLSRAKDRGDAWKRTAETYGARLVLKGAFSYDFQSLKVYDGEAPVSLILFCAKELEKRGDRCGLRFSRDLAGTITGVELGYREATVTEAQAAEDLQRERVPSSSDATGRAD